MKTKKKIGIIGFGNMGQAIAQRLRADYEIYTFDKDETKTRRASGVIVCKYIEDAVNEDKILLLAVKPQDFNALLDTIKDFTQNKLIISIAAGISTSFIESHLNANARIIRVIPNMPAKIGYGMSCLCKSSSASDNDMVVAEEIFKYLGKTLALDEEKMDAATAVSGSGPGFLCDFIETNGMDSKKIEEFKIEFEQVAKDIGLSAPEASVLVETTVSGTLKMLEGSDINPGQLKGQVSSKGGTTEAGLNTWHKEGGTLSTAVKAALMRARELSK